MKKFLSKAAERHTVCAVCGSGDVGRFTAETAIHSLGMKQISKPAIFVFPELAVCLHCGFAAFAVPREQLGDLGKGNVAG